MFYFTQELLRSEPVPTIELTETQLKRIRAELRLITETAPGENEADPKSLVGENFNPYYDSVWLWCMDTDNGAKTEPTTLVDTYDDVMLNMISEINSVLSVANVLPIFD